jgi:hypothetical protein
VTFAWGFAHYLLALRYSGGQMRQLLGTATQVPALIGLVFLATTLYQVAFPLFLYFGLHHALNEAYLSRLVVGPSSTRSRLNATAALFHALAYLATLRWSRELAGIDPLWIWIGLAVAGALLVRSVRQSGAAGSARQLLGLCAPEAAAAALVVVSLFVRVTFLQFVLYHFVLWTVLPIERIGRRGRAAFVEYAALSFAAIGVAVLLSPLGPSSTRVSPRWFSEQFLLWSYLHITLSFALSDAHPKWAVDFFRGAVRRPVTLSASAAS